MLEAGSRVVVERFAESPEEAIDTVMTLAPQPAPDPSSLGPSEVLVRIRSAAVGWVDLLMSSGQYQHMAKPPYTPGLEGTGEIVGVGAEVKKVRVGSAVILDGMYAGPRSLGPYQSQGTFATYAVIPEAAAIPLPAPLDLDQGAALLSAYETAYHCLITRGRLAAGETVLILGASGSTGLAAVEIAKIVGATVIATGRSEKKLEVVKASGADHVIAGPFKDRVKELTGGKGVDVVYDGVGGETSLEALRCVRFGARFLIVGWASTPDVAKGKGGRGAPNANQLPTNLMMMKSLDVLGCPTAISTAMDPSSRPPRLRAILDWAEAGKLRPNVSHRFALSEYREALRSKWNGEIIGNAVLHP